MDYKKRALIIFLEGFIKGVMFCGIIAFIMLLVLWFFL